MKNEWFGSWFNTPYYHILYKNRDDSEAAKFIDKLCDHLKLCQVDKHILDLACGKGRHSIYMNKKGVSVTGIDYSIKNIELAKPFENDTLHFYHHDMRKVFAVNKFDYVLNLFTSFGYFETKEENLLTIKAVHDALIPGGRFLLDFLNPVTTKKALIKQERRKSSDIIFDISRELNDGFFVKNISVSDNGVTHSFQEKVKAIDYEEFMEYFQWANLSLVESFGDYSLNNYNPETSERLIFLTEKNAS